MGKRTTRGPQDLISVVRSGPGTLGPPRPRLLGSLLWIVPQHIQQKGGAHMPKIGGDKGVKVKDAGGARKTPIIRKGS